MKKILLTLMCSVFILSSCKKDVKEEKKSNEINKKVEVNNKSILNNKQRQSVPRSFKPGEKLKYTNNSLDNLDVLEGESYFDLDNQSIVIKTPVNNKQFKYYRSYSFNKNGVKALIFCITDSKPIAIRGNIGDYILEQTIPFSKITGQPLNLSKNDSLRVIVLNDDVFSTNDERKIKRLIEGIIYNTNNKRFIFDDIKPEETGGGVIIEGP